MEQEQSGHVGSLPPCRFTPRDVLALLAVGVSLARADGNQLLELVQVLVLALSRSG